MTEQEKVPGRLLDSPGKTGSGKIQNLSGHTYNVTISPKGDVSESCQKAILKYVSKNCEYYYVVAERGKNGQRHLHMCLVFATPRNKHGIEDDMWKYRVKKWHGDSIQRIAVVCTHMYNHSWYDDYLRKEEAVEVLLDAYDRDQITPLFPTPEMQECLQALKGKRVADASLHEHQLRWEETDHPVSVSGALMYLRNRMFVIKDMMVILDDRRVRQLALALYRYRSGDVTFSPEDDEWLNRADPNRGSLYVHHHVSAAPPGI